MLQNSIINNKDTLIEIIKGLQTPTNLSSISVRREGS